MKIQINRKQHLAGGAMLAVAIFAVVVASTLAAYLALVQGEYTNAARSQSWNSSMVTAESGVEDAMGLINQFEAVGNFSQVTNWSDPLNLSGGWTSLGGGLYTNSRVIMNGTVKIGEYHVIIDNNPVVILTNLPGNTRTFHAPTINAMGAGAWMGSTASGPAPMFAQAGLRASAPRRAVQIQTILSALFKGSMTTVYNVDFNGKNVVSDSFDPLDPAHSDYNTNFGYGTYNSAKRKDNGNVYTDGSLVGSIDVANSSVYGRVDTGPGGSTDLGPHGSVGPIGYVPTAGIDPGYSSDDMNVTFPPVSLPSNLSSAPLFSGSTISANGNYQINNVGSLNIQGGSPANPITVNLYLPNGFSLSGNQAINITNAIVTIYTAGDLKTAGNAAINNNTQNAENLSIYGLSGVNNIQFNGNASFTGTIYAPSAAFSFGGSGNSTYDFVGAVTAYSVKMNGNANFHFDENLLRSGPSSGFIPRYWKEVSAY